MDIILALMSLGGIGYGVYFLDKSTKESEYQRVKKVLLALLRKNHFVVTHDETKEMLRGIDKIKTEIRMKHLKGQDVRMIQHEIVLSGIDEVIEKIEEYEKLTREDVLLYEKFWDKWYGKK